MTYKRNTWREEKIQPGVGDGSQARTRLKASKDMCLAGKTDGSRVLSCDKLLSAQQKQSLFSRMASKTRQAAEISDTDYLSCAIRACVRGA